MSLFCLLCIPLVFFLRKTISTQGGTSIWALPLGGIAVLLDYFIGPLLTPSGFGFSRWMSGFVDVVGLPALIPLLACFVLVMLKVFPLNVDYAGFALLWLVPLAVIRSISGGLPSPIPLVFIPLLWIAQAVGVSFFIKLIIQNPRPQTIVPSVMGIVALPVAAVTSWWAFFSQETFLGFLLLFVSLIPTIISLAIISHKGTEAQSSSREAF